MHDEASSESRALAWPQCCAFMELFRAWRIGIRFSCIALAFLGVLGTYLVGRTLDGMWSKKNSPVVTTAGNVSELDFFIQGAGCEETKRWVTEQEQAKSAKRAGVFQLLMRHARVSANEVAAGVVALSPGRVLGGCSRGFMGPVWVAAMHPGYGAVFFLIASFIWAIFGGAVARVAAMQATRDERVGMGEALRYSRSKLGGFFFAPLMPVGGVIGGLLLMALVTLILSWIPSLGEILVGLLLILAIMGGLVLAFLVIGGIVGSPLTYPTIAVEGSDAFDAFSRTFSYVYQRPWRTTFYSAVSIAYGAICFLFVKFFVRLALWSAHLGLGLTMNWFSASTAESGPSAVSKLDAIWQAPSLTGETPFYGQFGSSVELAGGSWFAQVLFKFWIYGLWGLVAAFVVSLFYASSTLVYLLLRREVDATDLEEVYVEESSMDETAQMPAAAGPASGGGASGTSLPIIGQSGS